MSDGHSPAPPGVRWKGPFLVPDPASLVGEPLDDIGSVGVSGGNVTAFADIELSESEEEAIELLNSPALEQYIVNMIGALREEHGEFNRPVTTALESTPVAEYAQQLGIGDRLESARAKL